MMVLIGECKLLRISITKSNLQIWIMTIGNRYRSWRREWEGKRVSIYNYIRKSVHWKCNWVNNRLSKNMIWLMYRRNKRRIRELLVKWTISRNWYLNLRRRRISWWRSTKYRISRNNVLNDWKRSCKWYWKRTSITNSSIRIWGGKMSEWSNEYCDIRRNWNSYWYSIVVLSVKVYLVEYIVDIMICATDCVI